MFDKRKPFGTVMGNPAVKYAQDGKYYNAQHQEVTEFGVPCGPSEPDVVPESSEAEAGLDVAEEDVVEAPEVDAPDAAVDPDAAPEEKSTDDPVDLEALSWQEVKKRVEAAGGNWTNKIEGIAYLRGL